MTLEIKQLSKKFANQDRQTSLVLDQINLKISEGEFVSLLGPSGCGKSTLLSIIAGLQKPTTGQVLLNQEKILEPNPDKGVVFQKPALFPWLTVIENVMFPLKKRLTYKQSLDEARNFLEKVQLSQFENHYPHELSGGMQQRVAIARVLAMNPKLLLMDEPFGALDEQTRNILHEELEAIWLETRKTILFVTHSIREAIKLSDRILVMGTQPGKIIADKKVHLKRPRKQSDMAFLEEEIMALLRVEIEKNMKEVYAYVHRP